MKKLVLLFVILFPLSTVFAQDPGFGDEGGGDAQDAPVAPISQHVYEGIAVGILIAGYTFYKKRKIA